MPDLLSVFRALARSCLHSGSFQSKDNFRWQLRRTLTANSMAWRSQRIDEMRILTIRQVGLMVLPIAACAVTPAPLLEVAMEPARTVHVVRHGGRTCLVLKHGDLSGVASPLARDFRDAEHIEIGWGDRDYYAAAEPTVWMGLRALFWPKPGVLHVVGFRGSPRAYFPGSEVVALVSPSRASIGCTRVCARASSSMRRAM